MRLLLIQSVNKYLTIFWPLNIFKRKNYIFFKEKWFASKYLNKILIWLFGIKIMKLLSGDFSTLRSDTINRDEEFCDFVFEKHPDAIIYANFSDMIVQNRNESFQRIFGESVYNDIIGKSIKKFFLSEFRKMVRHN